LRAGCAAAVEAASEAKASAIRRDALLFIGSP
jgi:hypothetical protein